MHSLTLFDAVADVLHLQYVGSESPVVVVHQLRTRRTLLLDRSNAPLVLLKIPAKPGTRVGVYAKSLT